MLSKLFANYVVSVWSLSNISFIVGYNNECDCSKILKYKNNFFYLNEGVYGISDLQLSNMKILCI